MSPLSSASSVSPEEIARFSAQADEWWRPDGAFRALHELGPLRLDYLKARIAAPLKGLRFLDVGCGGGLMAEALAREGASVVGIDASGEAIGVARQHAKENGLSIDYRAATAEALASGAERFDAITAFEIVEHVANLPLFMQALSTLLKPGGTLMVATMNRTKRSFLLGIVLAEYALGWVPAGTHDWDKFVKPSELVDLWEKLGIRATDCSGVVFRPLSRRFVLVKAQASVNYFITGVKS